MKAFRPLKGQWLLKEHTLVGSAGAVEIGDMIQITSGGITVALGTNSATAIIGIAAEALANATATQTIRIWEPATQSCTFVGVVSDGAIAVGDTDSNRTCDLEDHAGVDTDTDSHHHLIIVKGRVACADAGTGEGEFRIAQRLENLNSF